MTQLDADLETLNKQIIKMLDDEQPFNKRDPLSELLRLIEDYWLKAETWFDTKMEPYKLTRAEKFEWKKPELFFSIVRHPCGQTRQRWVYDFESNEATLISEGKIPMSRSYSVEKDAIEVVESILMGKEHVCVSRVGDILVVNPRKLDHLVEAPKVTVDGRVKRFKNRVRELMREYCEYEETRYRNMLAYRRCPIP